MNYKITIPPQTEVRMVRIIKTTKKSTIKSVSVNNYVGIKVSILRKKHGYTQIELAKLLGLDRVSVVNIEKGRQGLTM